MLEQLNKDYLCLINKAYDATNRKEAIKLIHKATALAEQIAEIENQTMVRRA